MVAVFTGLGAGFERGSAATLGGAGLLGSSILGRAGEGVFLNASSGNLMLSRQDEFLVGRGPDVAIARTYNSLGNLAHDDNADLWRQSTDRRVFGLTGTANTAGSTVKRLSADGSEITYTWNGSHYATSEGSGAHDKLVFAANVWTWTDGDSRITETYAAHAGGIWRITAQSDIDANTVTFTYVAGAPEKLEKVTTQDGSYTKYVWTGSNISRVETWYSASGSGAPTQQLTRVHYSYDAQNRLIKVKVDLSPEDNSTATGSAYEIDYTYHGASNRIATIAQTDGSSLSIAYDGSNRVTQFVQTAASGDTRTTSIVYIDEAGGIRRTEITDPRGQVTKIFSKIATGELTRVIAPPAATGATPQEIQYVYDAAGNLTQALQVGVGQTSYAYDANGNVTQITDANGAVTTRTYDANNSITLETRTGSHSASASAPLYTRYVYDGENHLRYLISPEGRVSEYRYSDAGELLATIEYPQHSFAIGSDAQTLSAMNAWRDGLADRSSTQYTQFIYDGRGNLTDTYRYGAANTAGAPVNSEGYGLTRFVYNQAGQLLSRYTHSQQSETFVYDGMGRLVLSTDLAGGVTKIVFADAASTTTVTTNVAYNATTQTWDETAASSITVSTYNKAGDLITRAVSGSVVGDGSYTAGGSTSFLYDKNGQLRMSTDASARKSWFLYDKSGRKIADIGHDGQVVEYRYDQGGRLVAIARYYNKLTAAQLTTLADPTSELELGGNFARPTAHSYDIWQWSVYDAGGRVVQSIAGDGAVTAYEYDGAGRLIRTTGFYNKLASVSAYMTAAPATPVAVTVDAGRDRVIRSFYDRDGRLIGALNAEGALSRVIYDGAGRKVQELAYANLTSIALRATGTFDQLLASFSADPAKDVSIRYVYDGQGLLRFSIDGLNRVTEYVYNSGTDGWAIGLVRKTVVYAAPLGSVANYALATIKTAVAALANSANDRVTHSVYNDRGQLAYTLDATGAVTRLDYDASGRVIKTTQFASLYVISGIGADHQWQSNLNAWASSNGAGARISRHFYAERGELRFTVDAEGYVTRNDYDQEGRLFTQYRYASAIATSDTTTISDVWNANKGSSVKADYRYDNLGRLQDIYDANGVRRSKIYYANGAVGYEIEAYNQGADGGWTQFYYDQAGKLTIRRDYTAEHVGPSSLGATATEATHNQKLVNGDYQLIVTREGELRLLHKGEAIWSNGVREEVSGASYRLAAQTDGNLVVYRDVSGQASVAIWSSNTAGAHSGATFLELKSDGNLVLNKGAAPTGTGVIWSTGTAGVVAANPDAAYYHDTVYTYDGLGNVLTVKDPRNKTTTFEYDRAGRVTKQTDAAGGIAFLEYDAFGRGVKSIDVRGNASYAFFDQLGRVISEVDAEGYVTKTAYTAFGEIDRVTRYAQRATNVVSISAPPVTAAGDTGAVTKFAYDKLGRLTKVTDAELDAQAQEVYEQYTLNAFGQRTQVRNRLGGVTLYSYDLLGRTVTETLPVGSYRADGTVQAANVVNKYEYDARGNLTRKLEAFGLAEERVTIYEYDAADRLLRIKAESATIHSGAIAAGAAATPTEEFFYDRRGNVIEKRDAAGARTLYWYDWLDRLTHSLSPLGTLTRYIYDKNGNVTETRVFAAPVALPANAKAAAPLGAGEARITKYEYDALNRLVKTRTPAIQTALFNGAFAVATQDLVTELRYDAAGNVTRVIDANGNSSYSFYDKLGRKTTQIDAGLYRTDWTYDADANVLSERRYNNLSASPGDPPILPGAPGQHTDDRVTTFTYDKMGRRLTETRQGVKVHDGNGAHALNDVTVSYLYNALGEVTRKTESTGDQVNYTYDLGGRLITEARAGFTDFNGTNVTPTVDYYYNGLNDLSRTRQRGVATGNSATETLERVTVYEYDGAGRLASMTDANGFKRTYRYDAAGRITREEYNRVDLSGAANEAVGYDYDLEGRVVRQGLVLFQSNAWTRSGAAIDTVAIRYNAFGEIAERGLVHFDGAGQPDEVFSERFDYDKAGRLWRTTGGDGTWKYFMYDAAGNQTLAVASAGADLAWYSQINYVLDLWGANRANVATNLVAGVVATITRYNARNQAIEVREPQRERAAGVTDTLVTTRDFTAFGEVAYEINAAGHRIDYTYNTMGRLIRTDSPPVEAVGENGQWVTGYDAQGKPLANSASATTFRPVEHRYYDKSGRLVAFRDANGNLTRLTLLAGSGYGRAEAIIRVVTTADNKSVTTGYDIHGDARKVTDQINRVTLQQFDRMGRLTQVTRPTTLVESFAYDGLGQRTKHWNSLLGLANAEQITYDHQGRVTQHVAMGGDVTNYAHAWSSALTTSGMGTFGGWTQTTTYANSKVLSESTDVFGRTLSKTDLSGRVSTSVYDKAGRLVQRTGGTPMNYGYYNTGRVSEVYTHITNAQGWQKYGSAYAYDKVGNVTAESIKRTGVTDYWTEGWWEDVSWNPYEPEYIYHPPEHIYFVIDQTYSSATATYDALGRLLTWTETGSVNTGTSGNSHTPPASITYKYDANGNIRRSTASFRYLDANGAALANATTQDYWYRYDALNRVVTQKGALQSGAIVRGGVGVDLFYDDAGQRSYTLTSFSDVAYVWQEMPGWPESTWEQVPYYFINTRREDYSYDAGGRLTEVKVNQGYYDEWSGQTVDPTGPGIRRGAFGYDLMDRMTSQIDYEANGTTVAFSRTVGYNAKSQVVSDIVDTRRNNVVYRNSSTFNYGTGTGYALGSALTITTANYQNGSYQNTSLTTNTYEWWDGAVQKTIQYKPNQSQSTTHTTTYHYEHNGGQAHLWYVYVADGRPRGITFRNDMQGQAIRRDEYDNSSATNGDPHEIYYRFTGKQIGHVSNNGSLNTTYAASITNRTATAGTGAFRNGASGPSYHSDFDQSAPAINSYFQGSAGGAYTVQTGDTLQSIAARLWGDSSLWWRLAEANGLAGEASLVEGQTLMLPTGAIKNTHNASTFTPYNPAEIIGDTAPTTPVQPKPKKNKCGGFGAIILAVIAIVVAVIVAPYAAAWVGNLTGTAVAAGTTTAVTATGAAVAAGTVSVGATATIVGGAIAGAAGSIASQLVGVASGIQDKFSWSAVALAAIGGGVGAGVGGSALGRIAGWQGAALRGVVSSAVTQGIGVASGLQDKFSWAGVAVSGIAAGVSKFVSDKLPGAASIDAPATWQNVAVSGMAGAVAGAATRSLIEGSDFGDNLLAALPDVIGNTIGQSIANRIAAGAQEPQPIAPAAPEAMLIKASLTLDDKAVVELACQVPESPPAYEHLTAEELAALNEAGLSADRISAIDTTLGVQAAANAASPSAELSNSRRNALLRLLTGDDDAYDNLTDNLNTKLRNAYIDTDPEVIGVRQQMQGAQLSTDGTTLTGFALDLRQYQIAVHLGIWSQVHGSDTVASAVTSNQQVQAAADAINNAPALSTLDVQAGPELRAFVYEIADLTDNARLGGSGQGYEKVVAIERLDNEFVITAIRGGGSQGSRIFDLINSNTAAIFHIHHDKPLPGGGTLVQIPVGGDHSSVKFRDVPSFVYGGDDNRLYEVFRQNNVYRYRRILNGGAIGAVNAYDVD